MMLSAGIGIWKLNQASEPGAEAPTTTTRKHDLPSYAYMPEAPPGTPAAYQAAVDYPDQLSKIPCYCHCGESAGHESVLDCFIASREGEDITFSRHGAG